MAQARLAVVVAATLALIAKLALASSTAGTEDVRTWAGFALGVRQRGPVGVYGIDFFARNGTLYNHPPLVGYFLELLNIMARVGVPLQISLRTFASAADVISAVIVFEIVRRRRSSFSAMVAGVTVAASPILMLVSGYHGNTDPIVLMLLWLGCYLIIDRRMGALGGMAVALSISVKLVPIVAIPVLVTWLIRCGGPRHLRQVAIGFIATMAAVWGPPILFEWSALRRDVFGYAGIPYRPWGLIKLADAMDLSTVSTWLTGPGRYAVLLVSALIPAVLSWIRPRATMECVGLSLGSFLVLSPAFGVQYLAWVVTASVLLGRKSAIVYNLASGLFLLVVYIHWNGGLMWTSVAEGQAFSPAELNLALGVWAVLIFVMYRGISRYRAVEVR